MCMYSSCGSSKPAHRGGEEFISLTNSEVLSNASDTRIMAGSLLYDFHETELNFS